MRKLGIIVLFAAFGLFSTNLTAQEVKEEAKEVVKEMKEQAQDKAEVKLSELPEAVKKTLADKYAEFTAEKAFKKTKEGKEYFYVKLSKDGEYKKIMLTAEGEVIEKKAEKKVY